MILPHTVSIVRATQATDAYGDPALDWTSASSVEVPAWVQPRTSAEDNNGRRAVISGWMTFLPAYVDITAHDRIIWGSETFEVDGDPAELWNPSGPHHLEVPLRRVTG